LELQRILQYFWRYLLHFIFFEPILKAENIAAYYSDLHCLGSIAYITGLYVSALDIARVVLHLSVVGITLLPQ
jgi:hypothetical protein